MLLDKVEGHKYIIKEDSDYIVTIETKNVFLSEALSYVSEAVNKEATLANSVYLTEGAQFMVKSPLATPKKVYYASFCLYEMPTCCGMVVLNSVRSYTPGWGKKVFYLAEEIAKMFGYTAMIGTAVLPGNQKAVEIAKTIGWQEIGPRFVNRRSRNTIVTLIKVLGQQS